MAMSAPVLSTPAEHVFEDPTPAIPTTGDRLSDEQLYLQYEIKRTVCEIRDGRWKRIALQFPDQMLVDAPRVFERLRDDLRVERPRRRRSEAIECPAEADAVTANLQSVRLDEQKGKPDAIADEQEDVEERLTILADTSYGACCVDEVAAEHVDADVVVHYGRSCLSPTSRLPVIYVFTSQPLDLDAAVGCFKHTYPDPGEKVCLMADIPYHHHLPALADRIRAEGYTNVFETAIIHNPSSPLPNRTLPRDVQEDGNKLREYAVFHISDPPTSLLLILSSRVRAIHILPTDQVHPAGALEASTAALLRRRYALLTRLSTVPVFGILINTLSVRNYLAALSHCQDLVTKAGKKSYVFVVGKVNAAKVANFSEIGGWVVIGCWESSLIESKEFYRPIITPFELEVALTDDADRVWGGEWVGDFGALLGRERKQAIDQAVATEDRGGVSEDTLVQDHESGDWDDQPSDDEPPEFDLRTGQYVSHSRPMGRPKPVAPAAPSALNADGASSASAPPSSALVQRAKGDVATINGTLSPAAEFLRSQRTWQGLGSDYHEIEYERNEEGGIRGAGMEEGRAGVARGYRVGAEGEVES
ncbi:Diphthamide biosynthesis protein 2 [Teratosphaeriaceae sp. CCFEE 6253]|nr:Diphthamide biosynthesis protein 2 [Teratosphaeriaceae sp. CCFEE 6253]